MGPCFFIFLESLCLYLQLENADISHSLELIQKKSISQQKIRQNTKKDSRRGKEKQKNYKIENKN